jgi:hypothetical protein
VRALDYHCQSRIARCPWKKETKDIPFSCYGLIRR